MIVGREAERARLASCWQAATAGSGTSLLLLGDAGIGKSSLVAACVSDAAAAGVTIVSIEGVRGEEDLAWAGLGQLVAALGTALARTGDAHRSVLERAVGRRSGPTPEPHAVYVSTLALLTEVADAGPVLLVVDDLHWLDRETTRTLVFLTRRLNGVAVSVVAAARSLEQTDMPHVVRIETLDETGAAEVIRQAAAPLVVAPMVIHHLIGASGGNPLAIGSLVRALDDRQLTGVDALPNPLPLAPGLDAMLAARVERLPEDTRQALALLAMSGASSRPVTTVLDLCAADAEVFAAAEVADVVRIHQGTIRFTHPLFRSAAYWTLDAPTRRALHQRCADAETDPVRRLLHSADATVGTDPVLGGALLALADSAAARGAHSTAVTLLLRAEPHLAATDHAPRVAVDIARHAMTSGNVALVRARIDDLDVASDPVRIHGLRAALAEIDDDLTAAVRESSTAVAAAHDADAAADQVTSAAITLIRRARVGMAQDFIRAHPIDRTHLDSRRSVRLDVVDGFSQIATSRVDPEAIASAARYEELMVDDDTIAANADVLTNVALGLALARMHDAALEVASRLERIAIERTVPHVMPAVETARCMVAFRRNFAAAAAHAEEAISLAAALGQPSLGAAARNYQLVVLGQLGRSETLTLADQLLATGDVQDRISALSGVAIYWLTLAVPEKALAAALRLHRDPDIDPHRFTSRWQADLGEAAARCGDVRLVDEAIAQIEEIDGGGGELWLVGAAARLRGMIAPIDECGTHFQESVEAMEKAVHASAVARAELLWGERLRRARRRAEARPHLERARDLFRDIACGRWMERAELELVAAGAASGTTDHTRDAERVLTGQELHVARLAVAGASYKDIAAQLFVSPRTVESHLSSIYRKLGVKNRAGLSVLATTEVALQPVT